MRLLAAGHRSRVFGAAILLIAAAVLVGLALVASQPVSESSVLRSRRCSAAFSSAAAGRRPGPDRAAAGVGRRPDYGPSPGPSPVLIDPLDPRAGEGASRVGAPLMALLVVVGLGVTAAAATIAYAGMVRRR